MKYVVGLGAALLATWLLLSELTTSALIGLATHGDAHGHELMLLFTVLSVGAVLWIALRMRIVDDEGVPLSIHTLRAVAYVPWLLWEVVKANIDVARRVYTMDIAPEMITYEAVQQTAVGRVLFANSITLTPGTVSVRMYDTEVMVHALHHEAATEVESGTMNRKVAALEGAP